MNKNILGIAACTAFLLSLYTSVCASQAYAYNHPLDGFNVKMTYCMSVQRYENRAMEDIGCLEGNGNGKAGVKIQILKKMAQRMNQNKHSYEYKQLVSKEGLTVIFNDPTVNSNGKAQVWQDVKGKLYTVIERDE